LDKNAFTHTPTALRGWCVAVLWGEYSTDKKLSTKKIIFVFESIVQGQLISSSNLEIPGYALGYITLGPTDSHLDYSTG
jgi:hypothetical protein